MVRCGSTPWSLRTGPTRLESPSWWHPGSTPMLLTQSTRRVTSTRASHASSSRKSCDRAQLEVVGKLRRARFSCFRVAIAITIFASSEMHTAPEHGAIHTHWRPPAFKGPSSSCRSRRMGARPAPALLLGLVEDEHADHRRDNDVGYIFTIETRVGRAKARDIPQR